MQTIEEKRLQEKEIVSKMIQIYCSKKHGSKDGLCKECEELDTYAQMRSDKCPFIETKTFCSNCKVHCYKPKMREKIREVMKFSGPRMMFHNPILVCKHMMESAKEKKRLKED